MTRRERLEKKMQQRIDWSASREKKFVAEFEKSDLREEKSGIPLGQPILVGHHSESRMRKTIERSQKAMERAHEHAEMSKYHAGKAAGINHQLKSSIFSDDSDAIEQLEERIAQHEAERERNNEVNKIIRQKPKNEKTGQKITALMSLGLSESTVEKLFTPDFCGRYGIPSYVNQNIAGRIKSDRGRLKRVRTEQKNRQDAENSETGITIKKNVYGDYFVTFAEKPERSIINDLKDSGYRWVRGSWVGAIDKLPESVRNIMAV